jgi:multiple antibiotic resistance protein
MKQQLAVYANAVLFTLAALLPIVNPLGSAPIFLSLSADLPTAARHRLAASVARHAFMLLAAAMLIGSYVLRLFGVSLPIVRVGGGLLVTANGWRLLNDDAKPAAEAKPVEAWEREVKRRAFYPLTFPLTIGPGSISIAITLGAQAQRGQGWNTAELLANMVGVSPHLLPGRDRDGRLPAALILYLVVRRGEHHLDRTGRSDSAAVAGARPPVTG